MRRKVLIVTILVLTMLLQSVVPFTTAYAATSVAITLNSKLYSAVKEDLQRQGITAEYKDANGIIVISESELERVTELNLENKEIDDLTGLDSFKNVTKLNLHANELTTESNLSVLDGLKLNDLDLSSNKLESVKSISSFKDIKNPDITNQKVTGRQIISVNVSEEIEERPTTIEVNLPDILLEDGNRIDPNWIEKSTIKNGSTGPDIDYAKSFAKGSTVLTLKVATGTGEGYKALKGLVKLEINVKDSKSKLANSQMKFYYVVVDQDETGIAFEDENLYKAVKDQLTQKQKINKELSTYESSANKNLYERAYDEALILVIKTDDVINNIPSLILNDKYIEDLTGLEQFVGLKSYLNLSYNYIDSVERIVELEQNKVSKEEELRARYQAILTELKANTEEYKLMKKLKQLKDK